MNRLFSLSIIIIVLVSSKLNAQSNFINGNVRDMADTVFYGATIRWIGTQETVETDSLGNFSIAIDNINDLRLVAIFEGYRPDTALVPGMGYFVQFRLKPYWLEEVEIRARREGTYIDPLQPIKTEVISQTELKKAACCDLAGCFETQSTVQPQTTNVLTNSKELRILGLSGVYNQVLVDGLPLIQGATYTYGIGTIPGSLVDKIFVTKGANSVRQGYESITGQIVVELKEPDKTDRLFLGAYVNSFLESQFNAQFSASFGKQKKWSNITALHASLPAQTIDRDNDRFVDLPFVTRYFVYNKIKFGNENAPGWHMRFSSRLLYEKRTGGQVGFRPELDGGGNYLYGQTLHYTQPEIYTKAGYRFNAKNAITLLASFVQHDQTAWYGTLSYDELQYNAYANLQYELEWGSAHSLKTGLSYRHLDRTEQIAFSNFDTLNRSFDGVYVARDRVVGAFAENVFSFNKWTLITGFRADKHPDFGWFFTPRALVKYDPVERLSFRASAGTGWRTVNLFSENITLLASSRDLIQNEILRPEEALNWGVNGTYSATWGNTEWLFSADFYQTRFFNQMFPDYDSIPNTALLRNFGGQAISNGLQLEAKGTFYKWLEIKLAYNFLDVFRMQNNLKQVLPFNPKHRLLATVSVAPEHGRWHADANMHFYGVQRLPNTDGYPEALRQPSESKPYAVLNLQFAYNFPVLELYAGCENVTGFRQNRPLLDWENPFGRNFDTAFVWGPTKGREFYVGMRYRLM